MDRPVYDNEGARDQVIAGTVMSARHAVGWSDQDNFPPPGGTRSMGET
jgi:hypothetical protein